MILIYLIKSTGCLAVLFLFYKVALEDKAMHQFKRFYLLASLIFSCTIPLITFTYETEAVAEQVFPIFQEFTEPVYIDNVVPNPPQKDYGDTMLWSLYGLGVLIFGGRFMLNLFRLKRKITASEKVPQKEFTLSLLDQSIVPHSFFKWIFLNREEYLNREIAPEVIAHEATHVREKHSWDILFIEMLQVVFWFNPLFWFTKVSIKLNHEFLADQGAIKQQVNIPKYQNILLSYASSTHHTALESPFNYSLTKKRIVMLSQSFSRKKLIVRALLLIPVIGLCALLFNEAIVAQPAFENQGTESSYQSQEGKIYARSIDVFIVDQNNYTVNNVSVSKTRLKASFEKLHTDLSKEERDRVINIHVSSKENISYEDLVFIQRIASEYGYHRIVTPDEEIVRSKGNTPAKPDETSVNSYAQQFVEGALRNGKNAIVIEVKNDSIYINGEYTPINKLRQRIDSVTANWSKEEYADPIRSVIFKGNSEAFIKRAEKEFQKTKLSQANNALRLIPPPPPAPPSMDFSPPPAPPGPPAPPSPVDHLMKMKDLGGIFFNENKKISYDEAIQLVTSTKAIGVRTPYPYSNPPETYISVQPSMVKATPEELATYKRLAKKYNANPNGKINAQEVALMYEIYTKMNTSQKKNSEAYPALPPPPPPAPKKVIKGKNDGDKNNPPPPPLPKKNELKVGASKTQQLPKPNRNNILDHLRVMNRHEAIFVYEGEEVSFREAMKLARQDRTLDVTSHIDDEYNKSTTHLKSKGWNAVFDAEHKLFRQEKVTIAYNGKTITEAEAKKLMFNKPRKVDLNILSQTKKEISVELVDVVQTEKQM